MLENLKNLQIGDVITFVNEKITDFFENDQLSITEIKQYNVDDMEMVIVEMDNFFLVSHNFESDEKFFVYQLIDEGDTATLEDEGYRFLDEDNEFRHKIVIRENEETHTYHPSDTGAIYGLEMFKTEAAESQEVSICEFVSNSARLENILIERDDDVAYILQGFAVEENDFELDE